MADNDDATEQSESRTGITRRRWIGLTGAGAAGAIAGCLGDDGDDGNGGGNGDDGNGSDDGNGDGDSDAPLIKNEFVTSVLASEQDIQFNRYNATLSTDWGVYRPMHATSIAESRTHGEYYPVGFSDWEINEESFVANIRQGITWHDGNQVTAEDVARGYKLAYYVQGADPATSEYVESADDVYAEDDSTMRIDFDGAYNPIGIRSNLLYTPFFAHTELYGEFMERFEDASSQEERDTVDGDLAEHVIDDPEPYASGPFELDGIDTQGVTLVKYDDWPWAEIQQDIEDEFGHDLSAYPDDLNWDTMFCRFFGDRQSLRQAAITGEVDGGDGLQVDGFDDLDANFPEYADYNPITSGWINALLWNWREGENADLWRDRRVRKAFAHIFDFEGLQQQASSFGTVDRTISGMSPPMEHLVSDDWDDVLTTYERDLDRAEELLQEAGCEKRGEEWYTPDDERFEVQWKGPSTVQWQVDYMEYAASNLSQFGIESNVEVVEGTTYFGQTIPSLDYEMARTYIGLASPLAGWETTWLRYDADDEEQEPFSYYLDEPHGEPGIEVPPIGEPDSDETMEVDPVALVEELYATTSEDRVQEISETLSWTFNQTLPKLPVTTNTYSWYMTQQWRYPDEFGEHPLAGIMPYTYMLPHLGLLQSKREDEVDF